MHLQYLSCPEVYFAQGGASVVACSLVEETIMKAQSLRESTWVVRIDVDDSVCVNWNGRSDG